MASLSALAFAAGGAGGGGAGAFGLGSLFGSSVLGGVGGLLGGLFGGRKKDPTFDINMKRYAAMIAEFQRAQFRQTQQYNVAQKFAEARTQAVLQDIDRAEANLAGGQREATRGAFDAAQQATAQLRQGAAGRGFSQDDSNFQAASAQLTSRAQRQFAQIESNHAAQLSALNQLRAQTRAGLMGGELGTLMSRIGGEAGLSQNMAMAHIAQQLQAQPQRNLGAELGSGLGSLAGLFMGSSLFG